jgi:hypothetical protein
MSNTLILLRRFAVFSCISAIGFAAESNAPAAATPGQPPETAYAEELKLALEPPVFNVNPGPEYSDKARDYNMVIGLERTPKGRLWAVWVSGGDSEDGYFVAATSDDNGRNWSKPRLVINPPEAPNGLKRRILVGVPWTDPLGRLWLFFDQSMGYFDGRGGSWYSICENPDSDNPVWSPPVRIWHGATINKPVVLSNGEWLLPVSLWKREWICSEMKNRAKPEKEKFPGYRELFHDLDGLREPHWFVSSDQGKTWTHRADVPSKDGRFDEHTLVELKDGRLWMLTRTMDGIVESHSPDFGKTWTAVAPSPQIKHVIKGARIFFRRLASGGILLVKLGKIDEQLEKRGQLMACISYDEGKTWGKGLMLDERENVTYPDGFQAPDGDIYIIYDRERAKEREILLARFTEADVKAGALKSPQSATKQMVSKALAPKKKKK